MEADGWELASPARSTGRYVRLTLKDEQLVVAISPTIIKDLAWAGERVAVHFGRGANAGKLRIAPHPDGYSGQRGGGKASLTLPVRHPIGLRRDAPTRRPPFEIVDGAVIVTLPPEFIAK